MADRLPALDAFLYILAGMLEESVDELLTSPRRP
jgi:hypothetical protein